MKRRSRRDLTPEEARQWQQVQESATPLRTGKKKILPPEKPVAAPNIARAPRAPLPRNAKPVALIPGDQTPGIDHHTARRFRQGKREIEATLDLHGMTQARAFQRLTSFIERHYAANVRMALVITGKGRGGEGGVLRAALPGWIEQTELARYVLALHPAKPEHGGDGAYYVLLRRRRG